jgi:hypothetical protein
MTNWKFHFWSSTCCWEIFSCIYSSFYRIYIGPTYNQSFLFSKNIFASTFTLNFILMGKTYNEPVSLLVPLNCLPLCAVNEKKKKNSAYNTADPCWMCSYIPENIMFNTTVQQKHVWQVYECIKITQATLGKNFPIYFHIKSNLLNLAQKY